MDDFAPGGTLYDVTRLHSKADRLLRAQGNRSGRGRMRADTTLRAEYYPRGFIVSSGEDVPRGQSLRSRMLVLEVSPGDVDLDVLTKVQLAAAQGLLASTMSAYLRWLAPRMGDPQANLPIRLRDLRAEAAGAGAHARTPDAVASLVLGFESFLEFAAQSRAITDARAEELRAKGRESLLEAANAQAEHQSGEEPTQRFLELLGACIVAGEAHVAAKTGEKPEDPGRWGWREIVTVTDEYERSEWRPQGRCVGWLEKDGSLLLEPEASFAAVQRMAREQGSGLPITQSTLWKRLAEKGLLASRDAARGRNKTRATIAGERKTVIHLVAGALSPENGPIGPNDPTPPENGPSGTSSRADSSSPSTESAREDGPKPAQTAPSGPDGPVGPFTGGGQASRGAQAAREDPTRDSEEGEDVSTPSRVEDEFLFGDDHDDGPEEEEVDHSGELFALGWRRAETSFISAEGAQDAGKEDPVARKLRYGVGIYKDRKWWSDDIGHPTPLALTAKDLCEAGPPIGDDGKRSDVPWPAAAEEMSPRLRQAVSYLQAEKRRFWDPGYSAWCASMRINHPRDMEKACKEANLHAELWINEGAGEEIWAFVALREGWYVPDRAIEEAVWLRATSARSPWAEPELLPDTVAPPLDDPPEPRG